MGGVAELDRALVGQAGRVPAVAGRQDAVEQVDPGRDRVEDVLRPADPHQVARPVGGQAVRRDLEGRRGPARGSSPTLTPADGVAVEVERDQGLGALGAEVGVAPPWTIPKRAWSGRVWASLQRPAQRIVRPTASAIASFDGGQGGAVVEAHRHVGPERLLDRDGPLGGQVEQAAVEVRPERDARLGDLRPGRPG